MPHKKKRPIDPRTPDTFTHLPKFIVGDDGDMTEQGRDFVIHCHYPRFIMEFASAGDAISGVPLWIDENPIFDPTHGDPAAQGARLMREAGDFFASQYSD